MVHGSCSSGLVRGGSCELFFLLELERERGLFSNQEDRCSFKTIDCRPLSRAGLEPARL